MRLLRVDRSPVRLFLFGLVGLFLMIGAVDVMWGHWVATPPDTYNEEITSKGRNQRRAFQRGGAARRPTFDEKRPAGYGQTG